MWPHIGKIQKRKENQVITQGQDGREMQMQRMGKEWPTNRMTKPNCAKGEREVGSWFQWNLPLLGCIFSLGVNLIPFPLCTGTEAAQEIKRRQQWYINKFQHQQHIKKKKEQLVKGLSNHEHIAPSAGLSLVRLSFCTFLLLDTFISYLVLVVWSQMSWWVCLLSEYRGTERGGVRTAQDSSLGRPSSAHSLLHGNIAAKKHRVS